MPIEIKLILITVCCLFIFENSAEQCEDPQLNTPEEKLREKIFCGYNPLMRPVKDHNTPVEVDLVIVVRTIQVYQMQNMDTIEVMLLMEMTWFDEHLQWDPKEYGGLKKISVFGGKIWTPILKLPSGYYEEYIMPRNCDVFSMGSVSCILGKSFNAICGNDYSNWPYDRQNCSIRMMSIYGTESLVDFVVQPDIKFDEFFVPNKYWDLLQAEGNYKKGNYPNTNETHPYVTYWFYLERHNSKPMAVILPLAFAMFFLTLLTQCVDVSCPNSLPLLLFNVIFHFSANALIMHNSPDNGDKVPHVVKYFRDSLYLSYLVLGHGLLVPWILNKKSVPPNWISVVAGFMKTDAGQLFLFNQLETENEESAHEGDPTKKYETQKKWRLFAMFIKKMFMFIVCICYIVLLSRFKL